MNKILLPVDFPNTELRVVRQAAYLARHFHCEIMLVHVVTPLSYPAGVLESGHEITARDLHARIIKQAQKDLDQSLRQELDGIAVKRLLLKGDPAREIVQAARDEKVDLIVMSTHGHGVFHRFLLGSVAAKVLHDSDCPVWTDSQLEEAPMRGAAEEAKADLLIIGHMPSGGHLGANGSGYAIIRESHIPVLSV